MEKLDITSLKNAVTRLEQGISRYESDITDLQIWQLRFQNRICLGKWIL